MELDVSHERAMSWLDPGPFLRGLAWLDAEGRPVRADPDDTMRLPWDTGERAALPIGMRIEFTARGASAVEIRYRARVPEPDEELAGLAHTFALWEGDHLVHETAAEPVEEGVVALQLPHHNGKFTVHPPESCSPVVLGVRAIDGTITPAPRGPRWLVHGDSITEGWWSTRPAHAWPAVTGRALGLDTVNLGYAGAARGELAAAEQIGTAPGRRDHARVSAPTAGRASVFGHPDARDDPGLHTPRTPRPPEARCSCSLPCCARRPSGPRTRWARRWRS